MVGISVGPQSADDEVLKVGIKGTSWTFLRKLILSS